MWELTSNINLVSRSMSKGNPISPARSLLSLWNLTSKMSCTRFSACGDVLTEGKIQQTETMHDTTWPPYPRRQFQPNSIDVYAVDWLIYRSTACASTSTVPEIRLLGIFSTITQARQAAGFGSFNLRLFREHRLSTTDFQALDLRRRELQGDESVGQAGVVIPVIRRCEYFVVD